MIYFHKTQYIIQLFTNSLMVKTIRYEVISRFLSPLLVIVGRVISYLYIFIYKTTDIAHILKFSTHDLIRSCTET